MLTVLTVADLRRWAALTRAGFEARRGEIDALNVFPVPDGDTGTNLFRSFAAAVDALRSDAGSHGPDAGAALHDAPRPGTAPEDHPSALVREARAMARAALMSGRGNSGVILSQLLAGFAEAVSADGSRVLGPDVLVTGLRLAADAARTAVDVPVEGTVLSVADAAAERAAAARSAGGDLAAVVDAALDGASEALRRTPDQLPALAAAGVVDAGGAGYVVALSALHRVVTGTEIADDAFGAYDPPASDSGKAPAAAGRDHDHGSRADDAGTSAAHPGPAAPGGPRYEVMYLLDDSDEAAVEVLRAELSPLGDSLVVAGGPQTWSVHVHVDDPGAAIEAGIRAGRPHRLDITHFGDQAQAAAPTRDREPAGDGGGGARSWREPPPAQSSTVGVVSCAAGPGLAALMREMGARVVPSHAGHRASAAEILDAARATGSPVVVVLPNDRDAVLAARAARDVGADQGVQLRVVPSTSPVHGLAALAVLDPEASSTDIVEAMTTAVAQTRMGSVAVATRDAETPAGRCRPGDVLGMLDKEICVVGDDVTEVVVDVVSRLTRSEGAAGAADPPGDADDIADQGELDSELVTVVLGAPGPHQGAVVGAVRAIENHLAANHPAATIEVIDGGQQHYLLVLGVQ